MGTTARLYFACSLQANDGGRFRFVAIYPPPYRESVPQHRLHFAVATRERHNMRLSYLRGGLSAGALAAYHGKLCRAEPGHRRGSAAARPRASGGAAFNRIRTVTINPRLDGLGEYTSAKTFREKFVAMGGVSK